MNTEQQTREQKLEAAFLQFIKHVRDMRFRQSDFDENFGCERRDKKRSSQKQVDKDLERMGITMDMDPTEGHIFFVKEENKLPVIK